MKNLTNQTNFFHLKKKRTKRLSSKETLERVDQSIYHSITPPSKLRSSGGSSPFSCFKPDRPYVILALPPKISFFSGFQSNLLLLLLYNYLNLYFLVQAISQAYSCKSELSLLPNP